jgi:dihydrofolate synthase / folylpolyglutamate synthase
MAAEPRRSLSTLTYDELIAELFPRLTGGIRWGLDRTQRMLADVGDPHHSFRVLHIGGTNGKGSVAAHLESVLRHDGRRVGLYSSPHLCTFRERIRIDGAAIGEAALLSVAERLWPAIQREQPSFFEATTAIAFLALAEAGVEIAVVEVGLGGRLDSTNVLASPDVVVLTNVSLDHIQLLGPTVEHIAREKAGIIKAGAPVVTAETGAAALAIFQQAAQAAGVQLDVMDAGEPHRVETSLDGTHFALRDSPWGTDLRLKTRLVGGHQAKNAALAVRALARLQDPPSERAVRDGLASVSWPGRLQLEQVGSVPWLFDVAHNIAGVDALVTALRALPLPRPVTAVVGVLGDKDWASMLRPICAVSDTVLLTAPPTAPADRRWDPDAVLREVPLEGAIAEPDFPAALEMAQRTAMREGGCVLITGSFHTVGDALAALDLCPDGRDVQMPLPSFLREPAPAANSRWL